MISIFVSGEHCTMTMIKIFQILIMPVLVITLWRFTFQLILNERKEFKLTIAPSLLAMMMVKMTVQGTMVCSDV